MRYRSALLLALFATFACAETLTVSLHSPANASPAVITSLQHEVESLLNNTGIRVSWITPDHQIAVEGYDRLAVIRLTGKCQVLNSPFAPYPGSAESLGETQVVDGEVLPFANVRCDAIRQFIWRDLAQLRSTNKEEALGRALARVTAHELFHILLRTQKHGNEGISRPAQRSADLIAPATRFSVRDERRIAETAVAESEDSDGSAGR
jgi:hypothetical protein